ncbi:unnamed protein product [Clonostachys chloroleuca]|uniref:Xylanolytic transcriptional activator regulatory domain-containing protein n=1 Tax=Clonostachys chloroleuca TaxID=1926264 RepID=A0AA35LRH3_9HYPO|nr:unnamed protein product [Clonostachys chloroleuca]
MTPGGRAFNGNDTSSSQSSIMSRLADVSSSDSPWPPDTAQSLSTRHSMPSQFQSRTSYDSDRYLRLFYENFHPAHPILVPSSMYAERAYPSYLRLVVDFAGSNYLPAGKSEQLKGRVFTDLTSNPDRSSCMVQAWLLLAIVLFSRDEVTEAQQAHTQATTIALEIGMNKASFSTTHHAEHSVEAESLRRTWWELLIAEIIISVPSRAIPFRCGSVPSDVLLPCDDSFYTGNCEIPKSARMSDFKRRALATDETIFSSSSYRVEAAVILGQVIRLNRLRDYHHDHLQSIQNALVSWSNHLPVEKRNIVDSYGNIDEILFQAHTIIAYASMLLHLPRSDLHALLPKCSDPFWPLVPGHSSASVRLLHSIKATDASRRMSDYLSLCPNIQKHTPFIIPALSLSGMTQIATTTTHSGDCFEHHYNRITLLLGCLKNMKRTWHLAEASYQRVRTCAAQLMADSMEKWNAEPLLRPLELSQTTPEGEINDTNFPIMAENAMSVIHETAFPELDPFYIDPICYNASVFSTIPEFETS